MALMSIRTKRLDIAEHCLGNLGNVRAARALQEGKSIKELDARVAMVAVQLGLLDDAKKLLLDCGRRARSGCPCPACCPSCRPGIPARCLFRFDLLNRVLQASGHWEDALLVAERHDRIHLKTTHYKYAKWLEEAGRLEEAVQVRKRPDPGHSQLPQPYRDAFFLVRRSTLSCRGRPVARCRGCSTSGA